MAAGPAEHWLAVKTASSLPVIVYSIARELAAARGVHGEKRG
jgi:hypothetical protein